MVLTKAEAVKALVNHCKKKYGNRFEFFFTGSFARNEESFNDYDIAIYDNKNDCRDWEDILLYFHNKVESDDKPIDAQVDQMFKVISRMSGNTLHNYKDELVKRYVYSDIKLKDKDNVKYENIYGNLWQKEVLLVNHKHRNMGLDKVQRAFRTI